MKIDLPDDRPRLAFTLDDGAEALLSPLGADDRLLLVEGLDELSIESRYNRFGQGLSRLSETELNYLSDVDQHNHVAWGAAVDGEGAGVGRYIRVADLGCAEIAVTVLDRFQGRGLGRLLFEGLAAVARFDGISALCFEVVPGNVAVNRMIEGLEVKLDQSGSALLGRVSVAEIPAGPAERDFVEVMIATRARGQSQH